MPIPTWTHSLARILAAAWLGVHALACARGDIVLGERGGTIGTAWNGNAGSADEGGAGTGGDGTAVGQAGVAAMSGTGVPPSGGAPGAVPEAGAPAAGNTSGSGADAGPTRTVDRPSSGCGKDPPSGEQSLEVYGLRAVYLVGLPVAYDKARAYPLIIAFRPTGMTTDEFRQALDLATVAGSEAIVVYPNPLTDSTAWEFTRDMPMFDLLLPKLKSEYCVDEDRVFALGDGAGALFANLVGCVNADDVRAIAPLSGAPRPPGPCMGNTAVLLIQSDSDPMMLGAGRSNRDFWVGRNSCDGRMFVSVAPPPCVAYAGCDPSVPVQYCEHSEDRLPSFAASAAWAFFKSL